MHLRCVCGYPVLIVGHWTGSSYQLSLHDGHLGKDSLALVACPQCRQPLVLRDLVGFPFMPADEPAVHVSPAKMWDDVSRLPRG